MGIPGRINRFQVKSPFGLQGPEVPDEDVVPLLIPDGSHPVEKLPGTISVLGNLRTDIRQQLAQQPDIKSSQIVSSMDSQGFLSISVKAQTASGEDFGDTVQFGSEGMAVNP